MILLRKKTILSTVLYLLIALFLTVEFEIYSADKMNYFVAWSLMINLITFIVLMKAKLAEIFHLGRVENGTVLWLAFFGGFPALFFVMLFLGPTIIEEHNRAVMYIMFIIHLIIMLCIIVVLGSGHGL